MFFSCMWWCVSKKSFIKELQKIARSFRLRDKAMSELKAEIVSKKEIDIMIREAMLKIREPTLHAIPQSARTTPHTPRTPLRKRADKLLNKAEIMAEIRSMLEKGQSTTEALYQITEVRGLCRKTCFFKYLRELREQKPELREHH